VRTIALHPDGGILIGGDFTSLNGLAHFGIGRLTPKLTVDNNFQASVGNGKVYAMAVLPDGRILVGGEFDTLNGVTRNNFGMLNADGTLSANFSWGTNGPVHAIAVQSDGKVLIGGAFSQVDIYNYSRMARFLADGRLDSAFLTPEIGDTVRTIALTTNDRILIGGDFTFVGSTTCNYLARLNSSGGLDTAFTTGASHRVRSIVVQPDNKILVAGDFTSLKGSTVNRIGRLDGSGNIDDSFNVGSDMGASDSVYSLALQADGKILVGGAFTSLNQLTRERIGRLNSDGRLDTSFVPGSTNGTVLAIAVQPDGKIAAGGEFTQFSDRTRTYIGRLVDEAAAFQKLTADSHGTEISWLVSGLNPQFERVTFEYSKDGMSYTPLGRATYNGTSWFLGGNLYKPMGNAFIRANGFYSSGLGSGSRSLMQSVINVYSPQFDVLLPLSVK
jgi:uncharacterized delta-60 repeat protein